MSLVEFAEKVEQLCDVLISEMPYDNPARRKLQDLKEEAADISTGSLLSADDALIDRIEEALR